MKIIEIRASEDIIKKQSEIESKIAAYKSAQIYQLEHGGPGPVADYEIMAIVNEHNSEFEIVIKQENLE